MKKVLILVPFLLFMFAFKSIYVKDTQEPDINEAELGKLLFFDPILSKDQTISCANCHIPDHAFSDTIAFSRGVGNKFGKRNAPSTMNQSDRPYYFYDGRAATLEEQALFPIKDPLEMNLPVDSAVERLNRHNTYKNRFKQVYGKKPDAVLLGKAIAAFERTLETSNSAWDRFAHGDSSAVNEAVLRGRKLFNDKAGCFECHLGTDFTNDEFRNIGLYNEAELKDKGRFDVSGVKEDLGKFKVPGLRNVGVTSPYMHNGAFKTLREVLNYYNNPEQFVKGSINRDKAIVPLQLSEQELNDLESFLNSLTDQRFVKNK